MVLALAPRDVHALRDLAIHGGRLAPRVREARRQAALGGDARATQVAGTLQQLGLQVVDRSETSVTARGSAQLIKALFGSARQRSPRLGTAQPLPRLPAALHGLVTIAAGGDESRPARHPLNQPNGDLSAAELQQAYAVAGPTSAAGAAAPAVATVQFSNWNPSDLTQYARKLGLPDPVGSGAYLARTVDGGIADTSGQLEVAIDQEALLSVAPAVRQVAYFTPNTVLGQSDALNMIAKEAGARHIVAVSDSWGSCEYAAYGNFGTNGTFSNFDQALITTDENAILNALASGVTVFAASGDTGSHDCVDASGNPLNENDVDAPASFPQVIGVGGLTTQESGGVVTESGWKGSGGGYSAIWGRPTYQDGVVPPPNPGTPNDTARGVPDIATDGDPATGLLAYAGASRAAGGGGCGGDCTPPAGPVGGTSLSAPLAAGGLAASLAARQYASGVGDITSWLYRAAGSNALRDVTSGSNGGYTARPGWDEVTGLGAPLWAGLANRALLAATGGTAAPGAASVPVTVSLPTDNTFTKWGVLPGTHTNADCPSPGQSSASSAPPTTSPISGAGTFTVFGLDGTPFTNATDPSGTHFYGFNCHVLVVNQPPTPGSAGSALTAPAQLSAGQFLRSPNGRFVAAMQGDGNFVVYADGRPGFAVLTHAAGSGLTLQGDGNLVIYDSHGRAVWSTRTGGSGAQDQLVMQDDGNLVLYGPSGALWGTGLPGRNVLRAPGTLASGKSLTSTNGRFVAVMQGDGNLVIYGGGRALWGTRTHAPGSVLALQGDGNLVIYDSQGRAVWSTRTEGSGTTDQLIMQDDGNLVLYGARGAVWGTGSHA
ncbi:MAG TPA: hypothetical protein VGN54_11480 [Mycobacteriales bacterium]|nr:hypothetical protein [Mycobacteriales bacterium]